MTVMDFLESSCKTSRLAGVRAVAFGGEAGASPALLAAESAEPHAMLSSGTLKDPRSARCTRSITFANLKTRSVPLS